VSVTGFRGEPGRPPVGKHDRATWRRAPAVGRHPWPDLALLIVVLSIVSVLASELLTFTESVGAAIGAGVVAVGVWWLAAAARAWEWTVVPPPSPSGLMFGIGVPVIAIGTVTGGWLIAFGVDLVVLGAVALTAELRGQLQPAPGSDD
jgi:hypothetical protein